MSITQFLSQVEDIWRNFWIFILIIFLVIVALINEAKRDRGFTVLKENINRDLKDKKFENLGIWVFAQRMLDYIANKLVIRQLLNLYFFLPFSILLTLWLSANGSLDDPADTILFITFLSVMWYTRETVALRQESQKQTKVQSGRPLVVLNKEIGDKYSVYNAGNQVAVDISIRYFLGENEITKDQGAQGFVALAAKDMIEFGVTKRLVELADKVEPGFQVHVEYFNLNDVQRKDHLCTILEPNEKFLTRPGVGRFRIVRYE